MKSIIAQRLQLARTRRKFSQVEVFKRTGINNKTLSGYENDVSDPDYDTLKILAKLYKVSTDFLLGNDDNMLEIVEETDTPINSSPIGDMYRVPVIGQIPAGSPCMIFESVEEYEDIPRSWLNGHPEEYFVLDVKGDSMEGARIFDGDRALMHKQPSFENGQICAVGLINDPTEHYATLKYVYQIDSEYVELVPDNPKYARLKVKRIDICIYGILKYSFRRH